MGNEQIGDSRLPSDAVQQFHHLCLYGYVQRGSRLVADQQPGSLGDGPGDGRPLALPAAHLTGIGFGKAFFQTDHLQKPFDLRVLFSLSSYDRPQGIPNAGAARQTRVEG